MKFDNLCDLFPQAVNSLRDLFTKLDVIDQTCLSLKPFVHRILLLRLVTLAMVSISPLYRTPWSQFESIVQNALKDMINEILGSGNEETLLGQLEEDNVSEKCVDTMTCFIFKEISK